MTAATRAERLARDIAASYPALTVAAAVAVGPPDPAGHDVVINVTSLGMRPGDPLPVAVSQLAPGTLVCDIVTRPPQTRLLDEAPPGAASSIRVCLCWPARST